MPLGPAQRRGAGATILQDMQEGLMAWVIKRTDGKGGYVARPGSARSYVKRLQDARQFKTREDALKHRCPGNEIAVEMESER